LAIAFCEAGATRVSERSIQGIDLEVVLTDVKVALEVKTAQSDKVRFGKKDIDGLDARRTEGFTPYFAVLGPGLLDEWVFAQCFSAEIQAQRDYSIFQLRAYRDTALEATVSATFPAAVSKYSVVAAQGRTSGAEPSASRLCMLLSGLDQQAPMARKVGNPVTPLSRDRKGNSLPRLTPVGVAALSRPTAFLL